MCYNEWAKERMTLYISVDWAVAWLVAANLTAVVATVWDKSCARQRTWRVPERILWLVSLLGGAVFTYVTMLLTRHKTKRPRFMYGLPVMILFQAALVYLLWQRNFLILV